MSNLELCFAVNRNDSKFWVSYEMQRVSYFRATLEEPSESTYEFIHGSATVESLDESVACPIDYDEAQELAEGNSKKHEVQVG